MEETFDRIRASPERDRADIQSCIEHLLAERAQAAADDDMTAWSPEYRAYVEQALEASAADVAAGRVLTVDEVRKYLKQRANGPNA